MLSGMKVRINNLGAVKHGDIQLKPLTVFFGPNNTGKTWTAYIISAILGKWGLQAYTSAYATEKLAEVYPAIESASESLIEEGYGKVDLAQFLQTEGLNYFNNVAKLSPEWLPSFMGTNRINFENININFEDWENYHGRILENVPNIKVESTISMNKEGKALLNSVKANDDTVLYFYTQDSKIEEKLPRFIIRQFVAGCVFICIHQALHRGVYYFPAERTGFVSYILPVEIKTELQKDVEVNVVSEKEKNKKPLPGPIGDLIETIGSACIYGDYQLRAKDAKKNKQVKRFLELSAILQKEIIGGKIDFSSPETGVPRELLFKWQGDEDIVLDMPVASSTVKDLTPLALYLNFLAAGNELVVIDEPEMNLHPKAQAKFIEFVGLLISAGQSVILTTHSPYLIDHLGNLIRAAKVEDKDAIKDMFYLKTADAFIPHEKIGVFLFGDSGIRSAISEDGVIDWETFSDVSDEILEISFDM